MDKQQTITVTKPWNIKPSPQMEEAPDRKAKGVCLKCGQGYEVTTFEKEYKLICNCGNTLIL
jgi:hypothetical protein